jgi:cadmium resistance protein CadD (predicted permease)
MLETLLVGVGLYASTNIDDIFLTMAFFADRRLGRPAIVAGKFVGIFALALGSWAAAAFSLVIPPEWIALLGLVPLGLGLHGVWSSRKGVAEEDGEGGGIEKAPAAFLSQVGSVAGVTAANGGDNLGVYVPVFAKDLSVVPVYLAVFAAMTVVWCVVGKALVTHRLVAGFMQRLARVMLPYVLILLGLWILSDAIGLVMPAETPPPSIEESN